MLIEEENKLYLKKYIIEPPSSSYIAGFIDGDGCIFIRKIRDGFQTGISISQCRTNILQIIRYHFGGSIVSIHKERTTNNNNLRNQYNLVIRSNEYKFIIDYIKNDLIIKKEQINLLYNFSKLYNKHNLLYEKNELYKQCYNLNKYKISYE